MNENGGASLQPKLSRGPAWQASPPAYRLGTATVLVPRDSFEAEAAVAQLLAACSDSPDQRVLALHVEPVHYSYKNRQSRRHGSFRRPADIPDSPYNLEIQLATRACVKNPVFVILETALVNFVLPPALVAALGSPNCTFVVGGSNDLSDRHPDYGVSGSGWGAGHEALLEMLQLRGEKGERPPSLLDLVELGVCRGASVWNAPGEETAVEPMEHKTKEDFMVDISTPGSMKEHFLVGAASELIVSLQAYEALLQQPAGSSPAVRSAEASAAMRAEAVAASHGSSSSSSAGAVSSASAAPSTSAVPSASSSHPAPAHANGNGSTSGVGSGPSGNGTSATASSSQSASPAPTAAASAEAPQSSPAAPSDRAATAEVEQMAFGWGSSNEGLVRHTTQQQYAAANFLPLAQQGMKGGSASPEWVELKCHLFLAMQQHTASAELPTQFAMPLHELVAAVAAAGSSSGDVAAGPDSTGSSSGGSSSSHGEQTVWKLLSELTPMFQSHSVPGSQTVMVRLADAFPLSMPPSNMKSQFTRGADCNTYGQTREKTDHKMEKKQRDQVRTHVTQQKAVLDPSQIPLPAYQQTVAAVEEVWAEQTYMEQECAALVRMMASLDRDTGSCSAYMLPRIAIDEWCSNRAILHGRKHGLLYETQVAFLLKVQQDQLNCCFGEGFMNAKKNVTLKLDGVAAMAARQQKMWW